MAAQEMRQRLSDELDLTQQVLGVIPDRAFDGESSVDGTFDRHGEPVHQADTDADFRVVASMLLALDPDQRWGGLSRTVTSEGLSLYACSDHLAGLPIEREVFFRGVCARSRPSRIRSSPNSNSSP